MRREQRHFAERLIELPKEIQELEKRIKGAKEAIARDWQGYIKLDGRKTSIDFEPGSTRTKLYLAWTPKSLNDDEVCNRIELDYTLGNGHCKIRIHDNASNLETDKALLYYKEMLQVAEDMTKGAADPFKAAISGYSKDKKALEDKKSELVELKEKADKFFEEKKKAEFAEFFCKGATIITPTDKKLKIIQITADKFKYKTEHGQVTETEIAVFKNGFMNKPDGKKHTWRLIAE